MLNNEIDQLCIDTIRMLAVDMVEAANSGHPGMPLGAAPMAYVLWSRHLKHNPADPHWWDRDRFILSAGHGSALLYALLHLSGYDLSADELKRFRQWESKTPGHPESHMTAGVEMTTGPLGQGFATGVGMAVAERYLAAQYNRPDCKVVDHITYAIVSDGDLMEGVASEAASLAGHLKLGKLIYLYDDNHISIEGGTDLAFSESVDARFKAYGWNVLRVDDGNDLAAIDKAIAAAKTETRPSLICVRTHIGFGSPKQDSASAHGEPLGKTAMQATKERYNWASNPPFYIPTEVRRAMSASLQRGIDAQEQWRKRWQAYEKQHGEAAHELSRRLRGELPEGWEAALPQFEAQTAQGKNMQATRAASGKVINALAKRLPELIGGSADLAPSTKTLIDGADDATAEKPHGRNLRFGVREHAMGSCVNGMALHGGVLPYAATFFVFSDYMRPAIRLASIMQQHVIFVFTHDSIGLGEDGPTHQPIEHLASLRAMPGLTTLRPADANETVEAWRAALNVKGPVALVLSRQNLPVLDAQRYPIRDGVKRGAYVLREPSGTPQMILIASGSEVSLALDAAEKLEAQKIAARVVSMPCWELFAAQPQSYRDEVLPPKLTKRLAIEAASPFGWERWTGTHGATIGMERFGASAPAEVLLHKFGFSVDGVVDKARRLMDSPA